MSGLVGDENEGRAGGVAQCCGTGNLGTFGGGVNPNVPGLSTHALASSEPHELGQMPEVIERHVALRVNEPEQYFARVKKRKFRRWVESVSVVGDRCRLPCISPSSDKWGADS